MLPTEESSVSKDSRVIAMLKPTSARSVDDSGKVIKDGKNYQRDSLAPTSLKLRHQRETHRSDQPL